MKFDTDDLKASLKNYQQKASDQFKDFAENDWPDISRRYFFCNFRDNFYNWRNYYAVYALGLGGKNFG